MVSLALDILVRQKISLLSQHSLLKKWIVEDKRDWKLLVSAVVSLGESSNNLSVLLQALESKSAYVRRMAVIQALRIAQNKDEAIYIASKAIEGVSRVNYHPTIHQTFVDLVNDFRIWILFV